MKFNKWTLGLAALGVVSLASAVRADEAKNYLETAATGTQISGYVNTSAHWNLNGPTADVTGSGKADGFNLDAAEVTISKPLDETDWAAGYTFQTVYGSDAGSVGVPFGSSLASIKQAYVELRAPLGNGLDVKVGLWDTILGYESFDAGNNPNYSRSYGYGAEPTTYAGALASYKFADWISAQAGVANTPNGNPAGRSGVDSRKTYLGSVALTAPNSWGVLAGSTLYGAVAYGGQSSGYWSGPTYYYSDHSDSVNYYAGAVVNTGIKGLKVGAAYDYSGANYRNAYNYTYYYSGDVGLDDGSSWADAASLYASFQATDKLSLHARAEYAWAANSGSCDSVYALTGTVQYDLWKNVLSRVELRWDHANQGTFSSSNNKDAILLAANLIYKF